jgi:hypothetical protein
VRQKQNAAIEPPVRGQPTCIFQRTRPALHPQPVSGWHSLVVAGAICRLGASHSPVSGLYVQRVPRHKVTTAAIAAASRKVCVLCPPGPQALAVAAAAPSP